MNSPFLEWQALGWVACEKRLIHFLSRWFQAVCITDRQDGTVINIKASGSRMPVCTPALSLTRCVTLGKSHNFSVLSFPCALNKNTTISRGCKVTYDLSLHLKSLGQCLTNNIQYLWLIIIIISSDERDIAALNIFTALSPISSTKVSFFLGKNNKCIKTRSKWHSAHSFNLLHITSAILGTQTEKVGGVT